MKRIIPLVVFYILAGHVSAQKTFMVEKIGTHSKYYYHIGDRIKLRVSKQDTLLAGKLWSVGDSVISVSELRPFDVRLNEIGSVYKRFYFPRKLGRYCLFGSAGIFAIILINHLANNEQVFTPDLFYIPGAVLGTGLVSLSLSQKRCRIGLHWKIKVLDIHVN